MGYYINPPDKTKEEFLEEHGQKTTLEEVKGHDFSSDMLPVCLVDNGAFTAAGIAYCSNEVEAFLQPHDRRPKKWFLVKRELLKPYYNNK